MYNRISQFRYYRRYRGSLRECKRVKRAAGGKIFITISMFFHRASAAVASNIVGYMKCHGYIRAIYYIRERVLVIFTLKASRPNAFHCNVRSSTKYSHS